jgi:hypothetical protein
MLATRRSISHDGVGIPGVVSVYDRPRCVLLSRQTGCVLGVKYNYAIVVATAELMLANMHSWERHTLARGCWHRQDTDPGSSRSRYRSV